MGLSVHEPVLELSVCPVFTVPEIVGAAVLTGAEPGCTTAVCSELEGAEGPTASEAVTATRSVEPRSAVLTM